MVTALSRLRRSLLRMGWVPMTWHERGWPSGVYRGCVCSSLREYPFRVRVGASASAERRAILGRRCLLECLMGLVLFAGAVVLRDPTRRLPPSLPWWTLCGAHLPTPGLFGYGLGTWVRWREIHDYFPLSLTYARVTLDGWSAAPRHILPIRPAIRVAPAAGEAEDGIWRACMAWPLQLF